MRIEKQIDVDASPDEVFALVSDLARMPQWSAVTGEVVEPPEAVRGGATFRQRVTIGEDHPVVEFTIEEAAHPDSLVMRGGDEEETHIALTVEPRDPATRVWLEVRQQLPERHDGYDRLAWEKETERKVDMSLQRLKQAVEGSGAHRG